MAKLQDDGGVLERVGRDDFSKAADLRVGTPEAYAEELRERVREVAGDFASLHDLHKELCKTFEERVKRPDPAAWKAWKGGWYSRVEGIADRNRERYGMWAVWMERQAKMRVGGMCELLRQYLVLCTEFVEGAGVSLDEVRKRLEGFEAYFEDAIEATGIHMPLDEEKVRPALEAYEQGFSPLRAWIQGRQGDGEEIAMEARRRCGLALFRITPHIKIRRRAYQYVQEIAERLTRLVELVRGKADEEALRKELSSHDAAVAEFKRFADLR